MIIYNIITFISSPHWFTEKRWEVEMLVSDVYNNNFEVLGGLTTQLEDVNSLLLAIFIFFSCVN